jgi:hypothetical protein
MHAESGRGLTALATCQLRLRSRRCHGREVAPLRCPAEIAERLCDATVGREPCLHGGGVARRRLQRLELAEGRLVDRQCLADVLHDLRVRAWLREALRLRGVRRAHCVRAFDEVGVRQIPAPAAGERNQRGKSPSTSPGSGKRWTSCLEKTSVPSFRTSNCPDLPAAIVASNPCSFSSAARLAARRSYPLQTGQ